MNDRIEIKAALTVSDAGEITGTAWPFSGPDSAGDVITKGAFTAPATLPMLWAHDQSQVVGVWDSITETDAGLTVKGRLLIDDIPKAREVRAMIQTKAVSGISIGFRTKASKPRPGRGRTISALDLAEISIVAVPSHPAARITSIKSDGSTSTSTRKSTVENEDLEHVETKAAPVLDTKALDALTARLDKLEAKSNRPQIAAPSIATPDADLEAKAAFVEYARSGSVEAKALAYGSPSTGGIVAPESVSKNVIEKIVEFSPVRGLAQVINMGGPLLQLPRLVDEITVGEVGETDPRPESEPSFEQIDLKPFEMAVTVPVTRVLLEDAQIDLEAYLTAHMSRRFGKREAKWFINGNGTSQAEGVMTSTEVGTFEASGTAITSDDLIDLFYSIPTGYSNSGSWLMKSATMAAVRKLKDPDGGYLWERAIAAGQPPLLLGRPVYEAPDMPDPAAGTSPIIFGDFASGYAIGDRVGLQTIRDELTGASTGIVKLHARRRVGGRVVLGEALTKLVLAAA